MKQEREQEVQTEAFSQERVLIVGVEKDGSGEDFQRSMAEMKGLVEACFMETAGIITQKMEHISRELYIGSGKAREVRESLELLQADLVVFNDTLTPSQLRNLQKELNAPVLDRTALILEIFETRARTREAKLQVESAKLKYLLPRLVGMHGRLTRQGGASGSMSSRGAGEKKLELDRRRIEHRISELERELKVISRERQTQRKRRQNNRIPMVSLVGYTNAGKSTIMNGMIDLYVRDENKKVLERDMLFATLDTTVRRIRMENGRDFLLSDTVGFIHKLPHDLVKAFRSTLEEAANADLLLQVVDCSDPGCREQMKVTKQTISELGAGGIPMITVFNKADRSGEEMIYPQIPGRDKIYISAKEEVSVRMLAEMIADRVYAENVSAEFLIPYDRGNVVSYFMENARVISIEYGEKGVRLHVECHRADRDKYAEYNICQEIQGGD